MNSIRLIGAASVPPLIEKVRDTPKLRFTLAAAYLGFDGQPRMWRHDIDLYGNASVAAAEMIEVGRLFLVEGALSVRDFQNRRTGQMEQVCDIKPSTISPVSKTLVGVTRRDEGYYVADETVLNEAIIAGTLKTSPFKGTEENHPTVIEVVNRGLFRQESVIKGKTWDEDAAQTLSGAFEGTMVMLRGVLANEFHKDTQTGVERSGTYVRFDDVVKL